MIAKQERLLELCKEVLREDYVYLELMTYEVREDLESGESAVSCHVRNKRSGTEYTLSGHGVGNVDAFFHGLKDHFAREHTSLNTISIRDFGVRAKMETCEHTDRADAQAEVTLEIENSYGKRFRFDHTSRSVTRSSIIVTLLAVEYFVNSERAIVSLHQALEHARAEGRSDTIALYTRYMADLVENTSYSEVVERVRKANLG